MDVLVLRVAARFERWADQQPGQRQRARALTTPINKPKGIDREIVNTNGETVPVGEDTVDPHHRDIRPSDVFNPSPNSTAVRNFAETGRDLDKVLEKQVPKDKGYDNVRNLSQYLIRTEGGSGDGPQGKKT